MVLPIEADELVLNGFNARIPVAVAPPRERPVKNSGKRINFWYEQDYTGKENIYTCSLYRTVGHTERSCELHRLYEEDELKKV